MIRDERLLQSAKAGKSRSGKQSLIKWLEGGRLTRGQAISAKCFDCQGMGEAGECDQEGCALYPFSPYTPKSGV